MHSAGLLEKVPNYKSYFEQDGFVDVVEKQLTWPIGS